MPDRTQSFENHARIVPAYHYLTFLLLLAALLWRAYVVVTAFSVDALVSLLVVVALALVAFFARSFALAAQDRVIRLEERLRLSELAPDLRPRLAELTIDQICALRFASDDEAPELARSVLEERLTDRKAIKQRIRTWRPDHHRV
jgi:hypothetical protein